MPRKARDERLDTRTARLKLPIRKEPFWRNIQEGRAIGYRRLPGGKGGTWIARFYDNAATIKRRYQALGVADDMSDADGRSTLNFAQAQDAARTWFAEMVRTGGNLLEPLTVRQAVENYLGDYAARGGKVLRDVERLFNVHVLPEFGNRLVGDLTFKEITAWHRALALAPARIRSAPGAPQRVREATDENAKRARRSSANTILVSLKAALSLAYREERVATDDAWRRVKPFARVSVPRVRYLSDEEAERLVNASEPHLRNLVIAALLTGCRYAEIAALRPVDIDLSAGVANVRESKSHRPRSVVLTNEACRFFGGAMAGVRPDALMFRTATGAAWAKSFQAKPFKRASQDAQLSDVTFHTLRHTHASRLAMKGAPMAVIAAQLGHASVKVTEQHYAHLSPGYVADTIRMVFGTTGLVPETSVARFRG